MTASDESAYPFGGTVVPEKYQSQIMVSAQRWNVSPAILAAQLNAESSFNPFSISRDGAIGIAQFMPETARSLGIDPHDVSQSIDGMARLDAEYVKEFGSIDLALAAYNAGPGAVTKYGGVPPYAETQNYIKTIREAAGSVATGISGFVTSPVSVTDSLSGLSALLKNLDSGAFWRKVGVGALGAFLIALGIYFMMEKEGFKAVRQIEANIP